MAKPTAATLSVATVIIRLIPHPPNFTPLGASALFGGAKLNRPWNYLLPLITLFVTDLFLGFHAVMPYVYGSFCLTIWLGEKFLTKQFQPSRGAALAVVSAVQFFVITNFGVWASTAMYPKTALGLYQAYLMGLPFLRNMLFADVLFASGIIAVYRWFEASKLAQSDERVAKQLTKGII